MTDQRERVRYAWRLGQWTMPLGNCNNMRLCAFLDFLMDTAFLLLGPVLISFASVMILGLSYSFFFVILPLMEPQSPWVRALHVGWVLWLLINVIWNYAFCVITRNTGPHFEKVVRELAEATNFDYPETFEDVEEAARDHNQKMEIRRRRMQQQRRTWTMMGPEEWGFCRFTDQPKPPRSHYDHVTKTLVLNLDHYCPWVFNAVGYFNYRYFCTFLFWVSTAMLYGVWILYEPFSAISGGQRHERRQHVPKHSDRAAVAFSFMICLALGIGVISLAGFHLYLLFTAQTTVEFHGNWPKRQQARQRGTTWTNPYDVGWRHNWQLVFGSGNFLLALLVPSMRQPEFLPLPISGKLERRKCNDKRRDDDEEDGDEEEGLLTSRSSRPHEV